MESQVVYGNEKEFLPWAEEKIGVCFRRDAYTIGLIRDGDIVAVTVYDTYSQNDLCMHIASDGTKRWLNKEFLVKCFAYPFIQLGLERVTGLVDEENTRALQFDLNLGFREEGRHPKAGKNGSTLISLGLLKENCRFIPRE